MSVLNKLAEFVGKYLTYIVFAVVVAAFFFPQGFTWAASQTVLLLSVYHVRHGHDAACQRLCTGAQPS
mgnify:CR=1 FL=1